MKNYWNCSALADKIRGTSKPSAETWTGWRKWHKEAKSKHPFRYWLVEEAFDVLQKVVNYIPDKIHDFKYYINNRFILRTNSLTADPSHIRPGTWSDLGYRILPCLFDELVTFVEVELAWKNIAWDQEARKKYKIPFYAVGYWKFGAWRCPEAGLDYLNWEKSLTIDTSWGYSEDHPDYGKPTHQALKAIEIENLYKWYKDVYLKRPDPYELSGWSAHCDNIRQENLGDIFAGLDSSTEEEEKKVQKLLEKTRKIEEKYRNEDTNMLIRLIKIRESLWT